MKKYNLDYPGREQRFVLKSNLRRKVENWLHGIFSKGLFEAITSVWNFSMFSRRSPPHPPERSYKPTDSKGRLLVMRPIPPRPLPEFGDPSADAALPPRLYYNCDGIPVRTGAEGQKR